MGETLEWFMKPRVKTKPSTPQDGTNTNNFITEYDLDVCPPLSSHSHSPLSLDFLINIFQIEVVIRWKVVTFHKYRRRKVNILPIFLLFFKALLVKMVFPHSWMILDLVILVFNLMKSIFLINIKSWEEIILMRMI